jgi:hypothetical protein
MFTPWHVCYNKYTSASPNYASSIYINESLSYNLINTHQINRAATKALGICLFSHDQSNLKFHFWQKPSALYTTCTDDCEIRPNPYSEVLPSAILHTQYFPRDGICQDGGPGSEYSDCVMGTDCYDCGARERTNFNVDEFVYKLVDSHKTTHRYVLNISEVTIFNNMDIYNNTIQSFYNLTMEIFRNYMFTNTYCLQAH